MYRSNPELAQTLLWAFARHGSMPGQAAHNAPAVTQETEWMATDVAVGMSRPISVSRWTCNRTDTHVATHSVSGTEHLLTVHLTATHMDISADGRRIHAGHMPGGSFYLSEPGDLLQTVFHAPCDCIHVRLSPLFLAALDATLACLSSATGCVGQDGVIEQLAWALVSDEGEWGGQAFAERMASLMAMRLMYLGTQTDAANDESPAVQPLPQWRLNKAIAYIEDHLADEVKLSAMAEAAGLSPSYFAAQFRATTGQRPHHYVANCRIERAKAMLAEGPTAIIDVAAAVGFQNQAHFSTVFKRITGSTPHAWRCGAAGHTRHRHAVSETRTARQRVVR